MQTVPSDNTIAEDALIQLEEVFFIMNDKCYILKKDGGVEKDASCRDSETLHCMNDSSCKSEFHQNISLADLKQKFKEFRKRHKRD